MTYICLLQILAFIGGLIPMGSFEKMLLWWSSGFCYFNEDKMLLIVNVWDLLFSFFVSNLPPNFKLSF